MIWKRNRVYYTETDIIKIHKFYKKNFIEAYTFEEEINFEDFINEVSIWYKYFKTNFMIKKPNLKYIMNYIKYGIYFKNDEKRDKCIYEVKKYIDLYRNDEI